MSYAELLEQAQDKQKHLEDAEADADSMRYELRRAGEIKLSLMAENLMRRVAVVNDTEKDNIARLLPKAKAEADAELENQNREYERSV
jgi:DNA-binding protein YbaB